MSGLNTDSESVTLRIRGRVLERLHAHARAAGLNECMGLLACRDSLPTRVVTDACLLPAEASVGHAEATPQTILRYARRLRARRLRPVGLWHSHGQHDVYHSVTDDETMVRLLPAMAEWNFERPPHSTMAPTVTGLDAAVLPLEDGQTLQCSLVGPPIPGLRARERARWGRIRTTLARGRYASRRPRAFQDAGLLVLQGGGITLRLEVPTEASVITQVEDQAPFRRAPLFSIVVNERGDTFAETLMVHDLDGHVLTEKIPCTLDVAPEKASAPESGGGNIGCRSSKCFHTGARS